MSRVSIVKCDLCGYEFRTGEGADPSRGAWMVYTLDIRVTNGKALPLPLSGDACPACTKSTTDHMKGRKLRAEL